MIVLKKALDVPHNFDIFALAIEAHHDIVDHYRVF